MSISFRLVAELSQAQRSFAKCLEGFNFECIGSTQTDDERVICKSLEEFSRLINAIEDERGRLVSDNHMRMYNMRDALLSSDESEFLVIFFNLFLCVFPIEIAIITNVYINIGILTDIARCYTQSRESSFLCIN